MNLGAIVFTTPWLLVALALLPILWMILRAVPPAPIRRRFPGVALLLGLKDDDSVTDRTPWWLLLLRMLAVAAVITGLAGPILNPQARDDAAQTGPLMIVLDGSWASARAWPRERDLLDGMLAEAGRDARPVAITRLTAPSAPVFQAAETWRRSLSGLAPLPWEPTPGMTSGMAQGLGDTSFETRWFSDGLLREGRLDLLAELEARGPVTIYESGRPLATLAPPEIVDNTLELTATRLVPGPEQTVSVLAHGTNPNGGAEVLATLPLTFAAGEMTATGALSLPSELRARLTRIEISGQNHAGAVALTDDRLARREVALVAGRSDREGLELLSPLHYLERALSPAADLLDGAILDILPANPGVIVLADVATLSATEQAELLDWTNAGGTLLRFAGPRLAASDVSRSEEAPLMPVRLRTGGRTVGGAMSWGEPKALAPFPENSPFWGLDIPDDVTVNSQVIAQPDPTLADRVIAELADGTPLVTRKRIGAGQVILFHVTANAEWSTLPLSGLFVQMLERLSVTSGQGDALPPDLAASTWQPVTVLTASGRVEPGDTLPGVTGEMLLSDPLGPALRPGLYEGKDRRIARNVHDPDRGIAPMTWPEGTTVSGLERPDETPLGGWLLALALLILTADVIASLALSGRLLPARATLGLIALLMLPTDPAQAQQSDRDLAPEEMALAHVLTGNARLDDVTRAGLLGLGQTLFFRTSVEPSPPVGIDLETDELTFYPLLYWPITPEQPQPSAEAYARLNAYLRTGGMILFDTRDADIAGFGASSPNGAKLQRLAAPLDIPPLEPLPADHVLTRTFYLLQDFPGRYTGRTVWVEAAPPDAEQIEGMPFRNLNDGVTPVVIGGNDWAAAWAIDAVGNPLLPVGRGFAGERQREIAYRFGVNLVMHVLTGNYKSDQVHVPALLDRLGQ